MEEIVDFGGNTHKITSVEINQEIADVYKVFFPEDKIIIADAHQYLLDNFEEFDFIWSSPPCPSHGQYRYRIGVLAKGFKPLYPDMKLYEEIILLQHHFKGLYVVENTISYYKPLIKPQKVSRHYFWANFNIDEKKFPPRMIRSIKIQELQQVCGFKLSDFKIKNKRQILRNCVNSELALHILNQSIKNEQKKLI